ncbi:MAG: hypothetical protein HY908_35525 [Myxococcales bacterium]|nr:hypothetical protein [Myxococcales bacterium]
MPGPVAPDSTARATAEACRSERERELDAANGSAADVAAYRALLEALATDGVAVVARAAGGLPQPLGGMFERDERATRITLVRPLRSWDIDSVRDELFTLAHEAGHFRSWQEGWHTEAYLDALDALNHDPAARAPIDADPGAKRVALGAAQATLIYEEEARAWQFATDQLRALRYPRLDELARRRERSLAEYRLRLGIAE